MTVQDFRSNPVLVGAMRSLLNSDNGQPSVLARAILAVQTSKPEPTVGESSTEIVSVRRLSRITGFDESLELLLSCSEPLAPQTEEEPALFGVDPSQFKPAQ